ncbi:MAG: hypothetical protein IPP66_02915 [Anaerolineales bacterium]|nr:hypothetical protein [Anaerolineales bacterium]
MPTNNIYILFLIIVPLTMFSTGFFAARQFRPFENVQIFSLIYVKYRFLFSVLMGVFISIVFTIILSVSAEFSKQLFIGALLFLLATFSYYYGVTLGWGRALPPNENRILSDQINMLPENLLLENTLNSVKITVNSKKRWVLFVMSLSQWVILGFCALPIAGFIVISALQNYLPKYMNIPVWILVGGLVLYLIYTKFRETLEFIFDKEVIEIDGFVVRIEKSGSRFNDIKEYPAENIKRITTMFSYGVNNVAFKRAPFVNQNMPAFMMWHNHGLKRYRTFGRAIDLADAQTILETIYSKFPQYRG